MTKAIIIFVASLIVAPLAKAATEVECLAFAMYKEARGESMKGKRAVLDVIYNRMRIRGMNACGVVKQKAQFSWYKKGMKFKMSMKTMLDFLEVDDMETVLPAHVDHFHSGRKPRWAKKMKRTATIGRHYFYADKGGTK